ncbi:MAG TPA: helix-turn-helix transcriptional regulator [Hyphomicrobiaceae bacterium]|nr:helix-turn-helix transcriptional regulator [Hyphomicrobiaceae bacterium]
MQGQAKPIAFPKSEPARIEETWRSTILDYTAQISELHSPVSILDGLDGAVSKGTSVRVLGARRYGVDIPQRETLRMGENVFIHRSVPEGWWAEYMVVSQRKPSSVILMARHGLAPVTWTEALRMFEPIGIDRWAYELCLKYGMRDGLVCPVGGLRWVVAFWSRRVLTGWLSPQLRALMFMAANFAAIRLEQIVGPDAQRVGKQAMLTPRELSVLRLASDGFRTRKIAELLELGEETIRSHMKKAQMKLGAKDRLHAVAEALRLQLIP